MIRKLILVGVIVLGTAIVCGGYVAYQLLFPNGFSVAENSGSSTSVQLHEAALYDVDALAARMPFDQEYYRKVRDEGLAVYSSRHTVSPPRDGEADAAIRIAAYYVTWGDFYGEGLLPDLADFAVTAQHKIGGDDMLCNFETDGWDDMHYPNSDARSVQLCNQMIAGAKSDISPAFKLWGLHTAVVTTLECNKLAKTRQSKTPSMQMLPKVISLWEVSLAQLIKDKAPKNLTYGMPALLLSKCECDEATLNLVIGAIDQAYNESGSDSGLRIALDGDYYIHMAWIARGTGYANTVNDEQTQLFQQRLRQALQILEDGYAKYPNETAISYYMMTVALGESLDRDTMESWFQRAIKADPNNMYAYSSKAYYLQPRWYGTVEDECSFAQECIATQNWTYKIPMVMASTFDDIADHSDHDIFAHDEVWKFVEPAYRKFLGLYPRSTKYRTYFLRAAYLGHHQQIMQEQYKILGNNWDRLILSEEEYQAITADLGR